MIRENNREKGSRYESMAAVYLEKKGCRILERNYKRSTGEIDLILKDGLYLVFVEVKYRKNQTLGTSLEAVTPTKQRRILRTAQYYMTEHGISDTTPCRFDVVGVDGTVISHVKNAFGGI